MKIQLPDENIPQPKRKRTLPKHLLLTGVLLGGFVLLASQIDWVPTITNGVDALRDVIAPPTITTPQADILVQAPAKDNPIYRKVDIAGLQQQNSDVSRWLYIPDTNIDGVVMQEQTVGHFAYDATDINKQYNTFGSYLLPAAPVDPATEQMAQSAHTLIMGHMVQDSGRERQFSKLQLRYLNANSASSHPYIYLYYGDRSERYRVYSATMSDRIDPIYKLPYRIGSSAYEDLLTHITDTARYTLGDAPDKDTPILILSTCSTTNPNSERYYVVAVPDVVYTYADDTLQSYASYAWQQNK